MFIIRIVKINPIIGLNLNLKIKIKFYTINLTIMYNKFNTLASNQ